MTLPIRQLARAAFVLAGTAIAIASLVPSLSPPGQHQLDKAVHVGAFALLALLAVVGHQTGGGRWKALFAAGLLAVGIEVAQSFVPGRVGSLFDAAASLAGLPLGYVAGWLADRLVARAA